MILPSSHRLFQLWDRFWMRDAPPHTLALLRIGFGAFLLFYWGIQLPHVSLFYSREGLLLPLIEPGAFWTSLFLPPSPGIALLLFSVFLLAITAFTLGALTRVSGALVFLFSCYYWILTVHQFGTSFDRLFILIELVLCMSGSGNAFSVDMFLKHKSLWAWEPCSILPQRLIAFQISATYLGVGWQKMVLPAWGRGEVIAWGFVGRWATPLAWSIARMNLPMWVFDIFTSTVKYFEVAIPFGLWSKKYRWWFFLGGTLFHTSITLILGIWWFMVLIPAYIVFFEPEEVYVALRRWSGGRIA